MTSPDVLVVGGGVIGLSIARALALRGASVTLLDDGRAGAASRAAAGMLSPLDETGGSGPLHALADTSLELFPEFVASVEAESGLDVEFRACGKLHVALTAEDEAALAQLAVSPHAARYGVERLDGVVARRLEPVLSSAVRSAVLVRRDWRVDNRLLHEALGRAAAGAGVRLTRASAECVVVDGGRARGVVTAGVTRTAGAVVLAAGAWAGGFAPAAGRTPVRPVRGQMLALRADSPPLERVVATPRCYIIPRSDGRLLVGATVEDIGFTAGTTERALGALRAAVVEAMPAAASLPTMETWFGYRPGTADGLPILGADPKIEALFHAAGHYRNGILLAPVTAAAVAALILGEPEPIALDAFSPARFGRPEPDVVR